ncbi:transglycosylase family protein [Streptomyces sp. SID3343]|uniref:transglycosylase family protein n=1 Tax=Streptomyces sp. SID3343 TaxID=2690260 RepID=UPI0013709B84|nr:transglycosylase family protein [Streptomyces sp. SID3343]MYW01588.1 peptidoglycan DD-metalloendopeptidase family protein [Streptomyces sp. SID3343]
MLSGTGRHRRRSHSRTTRLIAAAGVAGVGVAMPIIGAGMAHAAPESTWDRVAQCESTNNWKINNGNGFYGGLQFTASTWREFGGTQYAARADLATKGQQIAIAEKVLASQGPGAWPVCSVKAGLTRGGAAADVDTSSGGKSAPKTATTPKAGTKTETKVQPKAETKTESKVEAKTETKVVEAPKVEEKAAAPVAETPKAAPVEAAPEAASAKTASYVVVAGDSLSRIAEARNVPGGWPKLYEANKSVVGQNPDLIFPGQSLAVDGSTSAAKPAEKTEAKTEAKVEAKTEAAPAPKAEAKTDPAPKAAPKQEAPKAETKTEPKAEAKADTKAKPKSEAASDTTAKSATGSGSFVAPVAGGSLSAGYGTGGSRWSSGHHTGQDFAVSTGTTVRAVTSGTVVSAGWGGAYGNEVVIRHADGKYTQYAHLSSISVKAGTKVQTGQKIALSGATGNVTGPHLHFEVRTTPNYGSAVNPMTWLRSHGVGV